MTNRKRGSTEPQWDSYPDKGCELYPKCLNCEREPGCKHDDESGTRGRQIPLEIRQQIIELHDGGASLKDLAHEFRRDPRSIVRIVSNGV